MKYKISVLTASLTIIACAVFAQGKTFTLKGQITGSPKNVIYLQYEGLSGKLITDSTLINNGSFIFKGAINGVAEGKVRTGLSKGGKSLPVFLSRGNQSVAINYANFENGVLSGTTVADELKKLNELKSGIIVQYSTGLAALIAANDAANSAVRAKDDQSTIANLNEEVARKRSDVMPLHYQMKALEVKFMDNYPQSYVTASLLKDNMEMKDLEKRYNMLPPEVANSSIGKIIKAGIENNKIGTPGTIAGMFASTELRGGQLSLSDYKGKYVLLDFWASWCKPCRAGNPHLLGLYAKYKDKGFEIIGVSDDDSAVEAWKKAVEDDQIGVWKHILRGLKKLPGTVNFDRTNSIADQYGVKSYPTKILIDPKGVIIGRFTSNDTEMDRQLAAIFN